MSSGFRSGDRVCFVGHPDHVAPPPIESLENQLAGTVVERGPGVGGHLLIVQFDQKSNMPEFPQVQVHPDQLERETT